MEKNFFCIDLSKYHLITIFLNSLPMIFNECVQDVYMDPPPNLPRNSFGPRTTVGKPTLIGILSLVSVSYELREVIIFPVQWQVVQDALLVTFTASVHWYCFFSTLVLLFALLRCYFWINSELYQVIHSFITP